MRIAITGAPGSGKSTLCKRLVDALASVKIGGILTQDIREGRERVGFEILDLLTGQRGVLAHRYLTNGPRLGRYRVNLTDIERIAVPALERALREAQLIIIDEIAPMELHSPRFIEAVTRVLDSSKDLIVTFKERFEHPLIARIRTEFSVFTLTPSTRDRLFHTTFAMIQSSMLLGKL